MGAAMLEVVGYLEAAAALAAAPLRKIFSGSGMKVGKGRCSNSGCCVSS